jgi:hypothetical protein
MEYYMLNTLRFASRIQFTQIMKTIAHSLLSSAALLALASAAYAGPSFQHTQMMTQIETENRIAAAGLVPLSKEDPAWAAKALAEYPLQTCVVSGEKLDPTGGAYDYAYVQPGAAPRLVRFSSLHSADQFRKDPTQYLKIIEVAEKSRSPVSA